MDILNQISDTLFNVQVFWPFLGAIGALSLLSIFIYISKSAKYAKVIEREKGEERKAWNNELDSHKTKNAELSGLIDSLKNQLGVQAKEILEIDKLREDLRKKDEALKNEILAKEKASVQLKSMESQLSGLQGELKALNSKLEAQAQESSSLDKLKEELKQRDELLRNETLAKDKFWAQLKNSESQLINLQNELNSSKEVYEGLKEQYADLESQVDVLKQQLALEKTLHERLMEEHQACKKAPEPS